LEALVANGRSTPGVRQTNDVAVVRFPREAPAKQRNKDREAKRN